ncbi:MAG: DMT family transporter [Proteobacteria bacterium]|nr:DMT family transporter [Pseudomonadota bacterium]
MSGQRPILALLLRLLAGLVLSTVFMVTKLAHQNGIPFAEILFWRQAITLPQILIYLALTGQLSVLATQRMGAQATRAFYGTIGMVFNFGAPILLPLAVSTTLGFTAPIFAVVLSAVVLREHVGRWRWSAVVLGFAGVLVIAHPGSLHVAPLGVVVGVTAGFMVAVVSIQLRSLGRTEPAITTVFYFALFSSLMLAPALPFTMVHHDARQWGMLIALGTLGTLAQWLLTAALRYGAVASVMVMDYSQLIWSTAYGWLIFAQLPPATTWLGAPLVVAAGGIIAWREHRLALARAHLAEAASG